MGANVLNEVDRIRQLMLLTESTIPKIINRLRKVLKNKFKTGDKKWKAFINAQGDDVYRKLNDLLSNQNLDDLAREFVVDYGIKTRRSLVESLTNKIKGKGIGEAREIYQNTFNQLSTRYDTFFNSIKRDGSINYNNLITKINSSVKTNFQELLEEKIGARLYRQLIYVPLKWNEKVIRSLNRAFENNLTSIRRYIGNAIKSQEKLDDEILKLLEQSMNAKNLGLKEDFYINKIQDIIASKKKTSESELRNIINDVKDVITKQNPELGKYLDEITQSGDILKKFDDIEKQTNISWGGAILEVLTKYKNMVWPFKDENGKRKWKEMFQRQIMFIVNANPSTPQEIYSQLLRQGFGRTVAIRIVNSYIATLIIYPIFVGVKNFFMSLVNSGLNLITGNEKEEAQTLLGYISEAFPSSAGRYWEFSPFTTYIPEFIGFLKNAGNFINTSAIKLANIVGMVGGTEDDVEKAKEAVRNLKNKVENTPLGFEAFVKSKKLTKLKDYDGVSGKTKEFVLLPNNDGQTNKWYFDTEKNTFSPY